MWRERTAQDSPHVDVGSGPSHPWPSSRHACDRLLESWAAIDEAVKAMVNVDSYPWSDG
jgi:hypothetical protein